MSKTLLLIVGILYYTTQLFDGLNYKMEETYINGKPEVIYSLDVDLTNEAIRVENGFSFGVLYGFETLSDMVSREGAICAVNGMFYQHYGLPMGMVIHDGLPVLNNDIGTPMVIIGTEGEADIVDMSMSLAAQYDGGIIELFGMNGQVPTNDWGLFDQLFGSTTRIRRPSTNYLITDNEVTEIVKSEGPVDITTSEYVLTYAGEDATLDVGDEVYITVTDDYEGFVIEEGFQSGGWLVDEGVSTAKDYESFVGYTTASQPRTLVGITSEGHMIFVVIDGRDNDRSRGVSGKEAAHIMIDLGCVKAAYLDGGASSTMSIEGQIVNKPSGGEERDIAHSIMIFVDK